MPDLRIDPSRRCVYLNGQELSLSPQEYRILYCLGRKPGEVVLKQDLLAVMWSTEDAASDCVDSFNPAAVDLVIFRLRKKLHDPAQNPIYLETRRGFGYILHHAQIVQGQIKGIEPAKVDEREQASAAQPSASWSGLFEAMAATQPWAALTRQEWQIFLLLGDEQATRLTNRALAQQLQMTEGTLKKHLQHIYRKLSVENRSGAALLAMRVKASFRVNEG
ncbi:MAG: winged helix-turn-helix domain-containing protein [Caldilineaceae bacterium]